jgi:phage pi2 protein 07
VVVGTRSAVFAPCPDLGLVILDEEQEHSYKSENAPRYSAKDVAIWRGIKESALVLLGSATPSVESMFYAKSGIYTLYTLKERFGFTMTVPEGYYIAVDKDSFMWLRKEETDKSLGLIVFSRPYTSTDSFSEELLIRATDSVTKKYIPGPSDGSYMVLDKEFLAPVCNIISDFPAGYAVEMRGLWKTEGEYMAGPYVSYTFVNPDNSRIITVEGFVYYPNKPKRDLLRQLESIIWSLKF